jgi:hypothetical protein
MLAISCTTRRVSWQGGPEKEQMPLRNSVVSIVFCGWGNEERASIRRGGLEKALP